MRFVRRLGDDPVEVDLAALSDALSEYPLRLIVVFGSRAEGRAGTLSDLDVAVLFADDVPDADRRRRLDEMTAVITDVTGIEAVDLVDLSNAPARVGYAALSTGHRLLGEEVTAVELEAKLLSKMLDFRPVLDEWRGALDRRIERGTYGRPR